MSFPQLNGSDALLGRGTSTTSNPLTFSWSSSPFAFFHHSAALFLLLNFFTSPIFVCKSTLHPEHTYWADDGTERAGTFSQPPSVSMGILNPSRSNICYKPLSLQRSVTSPFLSRKYVLCHFFQHTVQSCFALCLDELQRIGHRPAFSVLFHLLYNGFCALPAQPHLTWSPLHVLSVGVATQFLPVSMQLLPICFRMFGFVFF